MALSERGGGKRPKGTAGLKDEAPVEAALEPSAGGVHMEGKEAPRALDAVLAPFTPHAVSEV